MISIKTQEEIDIMKEGGKRHRLILDILSKMIKPNVSSYDLEKKARKLIEEEGDKGSFLNYKPKGAKRAYPACLCVSINDEIVHGIPNEEEKILKSGDIVSIDLGLTHKGLITDSAITVIVGDGSEKDKKLVEHTKEALYLGIKEAKVGNKIGDIGFVIGSFGRKLGYGVCEGLAGHGVGYKVHEDPFVPNEGVRNTGEVLKEGMVLAIEPMFTLGSSKIILAKDGYTYKTADGSKAAHFEHTIAITKEGPIILTK